MGLIRTIIVSALLFVAVCVGSIWLGLQLFLNFSWLPLIGISTVFALWVFYPFILKVKK